MNSSSHGFIGSHIEQFTELLPHDSITFNAHELFELSKLMKSDFDTVKDGADPEENLWIPAGYTYFGQFVDHDLTFDSTSSLAPQDRPPQGTHIPSNLRTPRFDLDSVYGDGPDAQPFMYSDDGATMLVQPEDLMRAANGRAIIGDKRNDENSIICQIHLGIIRYHNRVVQELLKENSDTWNVKGDLFASARNEVRWTYQLILVHDFLPRIIRQEVLKDLQVGTPQDRRHAYALYTANKRANLPREFVGAAYRYGHSSVRFGYRLNEQTILTIFRGTETDKNADTLLGFDPLPPLHVIDTWQRFFPNSKPGADIGITGRVAAEDAKHPTPPLLQYAYKFDPTIVDPLAVLPLSVPEPHARDQAAEAVKPDILPSYPKLKDDKDQPLPSLALLNLLRGNAYGIASGQSFVKALKKAGKPVKELDKKHLVIRVGTDARPVNPPPGDKPNTAAFRWADAPGNLGIRTPLWFYVLAEAQAPIVQAIPGGKDKTGELDRVFSETLLLNGEGALSQLGWVGGRIVAEVFYALLDMDEDSVFNHEQAKTFTPRLAGGSGSLLCMRNVLDYGRGL